MITMPTFVQVFELEKQAINSENRNLEPFPSLNFENPISFFNKFDKYYKDHFGLRLSFFKAYRNLIWNGLHENPLPRKVLLGKEDWLYFAYKNVLTEITGMKIFSKGELMKITENIQEIRNWTEARGIKFYVSIAPNKHTVYPEYLPFTTGEKVTKLSQLKKHLKQEIDFELIDLGEEIICRKAKRLLYFKDDTHWNDWGAFWGYRALIKTIQKDFETVQPLTQKQLSVGSQEHLGDLRRMMCSVQKERAPKIEVLDFPLSKQLKDRLKVPIYYQKDASNYENRYQKKNRTKKMLVFRDSFTEGLKKYLNETFGESVYIYHFKFDRDLVLKEKPDLIVYEIAERDLNKLMNL